MDVDAAGDHGVARTNHATMRPSPLAPGETSAGEN